MTANQRLYIACGLWLLGCMTGWLLEHGETFVALIASTAACVLVFFIGTARQQP